MSNEAMVTKLMANGALVTTNIICAFRNVDRADFVPEDRREVAYEDRPVGLAPGATISQPSTVAMMFELLQPIEGDQVMDVGSGSGQKNIGNVKNAEIIPATAEPGNGPSRRDFTQQGGQDVRG